MPALTSKGRLPLAVLSEDNELVAYFVVGLKDCCISEIFAKNGSLFSDVIKGYMEQFGITKLFLGLPAYDPLVRQAQKVADRYHVMQPGNFKIFNFKRVVESFMREKAKHEFIPDGEITIDSEIFGAWSIKKIGEEISVDSYEGKAQYILPDYTVYPFLFGTMKPQKCKENSNTEILVNAWFPLPLYCPYLT